MSSLANMCRASGDLTDTWTAMWSLPSGRFGLTGTGGDGHERPFTVYVANTGISILPLKTQEYFEPGGSGGNGSIFKCSYNRKKN